MNFYSYSPGCISHLSETYHKVTGKFFPSVLSRQGDPFVTRTISLKVVLEDFFTTIKSKKIKLIEPRPKENLLKQTERSLSNSDACQFSIL